MQLPFQRVFGDMRRQGSIGTEQTKEIDGHLRNRADSIDADGVQAGGRKAKGRFLGEPNRVFGRRKRKAHPREVRPPTFEQTNGPKEVEAVRILFQSVDQRIWRIPMRVGHRMISPRCLLRMTVSVNEFSETYLAKNCSRTAPSVNIPVPSKAASSNVRVISRPRANEIGPGAATRRTTGLDFTLSSPSICRKA